MSSVRFARRALTASFALAMFVAPTVATAGEHDNAGSSKAVCADAYKSGQTARKSGALRKAREALLMCASDRCPSMLQPDCMRWLTEVEAAMPTVSFAAKGPDGKDVMNVRVSMDGEPVADSLDGKSIPVDPGQHTFRFERAGEPPIEQQVVLREGEKARIVSASWAKPVAENVSTGGAPVATSSGSKTAAFIVGGLGVAGLATFGVLAIHGMSLRSDLEKECFGSCRQDQVDPNKTELLVADIALGVGVVSLGVATVLFLTGGSSSPETSAPPPKDTTAKVIKPKIVGVDFAPRSGGGSVDLIGRF